MEPDEDQSFTVEMYYKGDPRISIECINVSFDNGFLNVHLKEGVIEGHCLLGMIRYRILGAV